MNRNREKGGDEKPVVVIIGTEGKETEPLYFNIVIDRKRIRQRANVEVVGPLGQHKQLIDEIVIRRALKAEKVGMREEDIECWAVCDKDSMNCTLRELQEYAESKGVMLAFSSPCFELFILQHLTLSASNANSRQLQQKINVELGKIRRGLVYDKTDLSWLDQLVDSDPNVLNRAVQNCGQMEDVENTPYLTVHHLLQRLLNMAS